jgi:hypothetical protein
MAGPATLTISAIYLLAFLVLAIITLIWWNNLGGKEAFASIIYAIGDLFSWLGTEISDWWTNTAYPFISETATTVYNDITGTIAADVGVLEGIDSKGERALKRIKDLLKVASVTQLLPDDNVYRIDVIFPDFYYDFTFGRMKKQLALGTGKIHIPNDTGDYIYKYGTTKMAILGRYPSSTYIGINLVSVPKRMAATFLHLLIPTPVALAWEKYYIHTYRLSHQNNFPPGNTKYG